MNNYSVINRVSLSSLDLYDKVTVFIIYVDNMQILGMFYGILLRITFSHARIKYIKLSKAKVLSDIKEVIEDRDIPGIKYTNRQLLPKIQNEFPLANNKVRFIGDEITVITAINRDTVKYTYTLINSVIRKINYSNLRSCT